MSRRTGIVKRRRKHLKTKSFSIDHQFTPTPTLTPTTAVTAKTSRKFAQRRQTRQPTFAIDDNNQMYMQKMQFVGKGFPLL